MKCIKDPLKEFTELPLQEFFKRRDPLSENRKEFKFLLPLNIIPDLLEFLKSDYFLITEDGNPVHKYRTLYFDTDDFKFFNLHRQGKYNRIKIRIREYKTLQVNSFMECKRKVKGRHTHKFRVQIENADPNALQQKFILENLAKYNLQPKDLRNNLTISYDRIFLLSKDRKRRVSIDYDISATSDKAEPTDVIPDYAVLEIKDDNTPKKIINYLKRKHSIRQTRFSKYCVSLCLLEDKIKKNKWKQVLKYHNK